MKVSVVMTTYNGAERVVRQMESLRRQNYPIDEVLIFDDRSRDNTIEVVENYIVAHKLRNWKLTVNPHNYGWKRNFMEGINQAEGDIIFPCDQDDVWHIDKVGNMVKALREHSEIMLLSCDIQPIYEEASVRIHRYHQRISERSDLIAKYVFTKRFFTIPHPGCSLAIRKVFFDEVKEYWQEGFPHDEFLWLMASLVDGVFFYNEILIDFYRGAYNVSDIRYKDIQLQKQNLNYIKMMLIQMEQYCMNNPEKVEQSRLKRVQKAKIWCDKRMRLMETRNPLRWLMLMPYWGYYNSLRNCLSDLYLVLFGCFKRAGKT